MEIEKWSIEKIEKQKWEEVEGADTSWSNNALAPRDYSKPCHCPNKIIYIKGYHIWWCSTHYQPHSHCILGRIEKLIEENCLVTLNKTN